MYIGLWIWIGSLQQAAAQQAVRLPDEKIAIADFGLAGRIPSAIDLVGPADGPAGATRALLVRGFQCWIEGLEHCSVADPNDPRVRAIRVFLGQGPLDRDGLMTVDFPDRTQVDVRLRRTLDRTPTNWDRSIYEPAVIPESVRAPGLPAVPSQADEFVDFVYHGTPAIEAALQRLRQRLGTSSDRAQAAPAELGDERRPELSLGLTP